MRSTGASASKGSQAAPVLAMAIWAISRSEPRCIHRPDHLRRARGPARRARAPDAVARRIDLGIGQRRVAGRGSRRRRGCAATVRRRSRPAARRAGSPGGCGPSRTGPGGAGAGPASRSPAIVRRSLIVLLSPSVVAPKSRSSPAAVIAPSTASFQAAVRRRRQTTALSCRATTARSRTRIAGRSLERTVADQGMLDRA